MRCCDSNGPVPVFVGCKQTWDEERRGTAFERVFLKKKKRRAGNASVCVCLCENVYTCVNVWRVRHKAMDGWMDGWIARKVEKSLTNHRPT